MELDVRKEMTMWPNARSVLLVDAVGATVTALATILLLAGERIRTGMPPEFLYAMGLVRRASPALI